MKEKRSVVLGDKGELASNITDRRPGSRRGRSPGDMPTDRSLAIPGRGQ